MRLGDITTYGSWADVRAAFEKAAKQYEKLLKIAQTTKKRDKRNLVLFNLGSRAYHEIDRAYRLFEESTDLLAWVARNLFEINMILRFVLASEEDLDRWQAEAGGDERDIILGILALSSADTKEEDRQKLLGRIAEIEGVLSRHKLNAEKPLQLRTLASKVGMDSDYEAFFKLYSKYVHPSSWLVNSSEQRRQEWRDILSVQAQFYAAETFGRLEEAFGIDGDKHGLAPVSPDATAAGTSPTTPVTSAPPRKAP